LLFGFVKHILSPILAVIVGAYVWSQILWTRIDSAFNYGSYYVRWCIQKFPDSVI